MTNHSSVPTEGTHTQRERGEERDNLLLRIKNHQIKPSKQASKKREEKKREREINYSAPPLIDDASLRWLNLLNIRYTATGKRKKEKRKGSHAF